MSGYLPGVYFLTGSTFLHFPYFCDDEQKEVVYNQIKKAREKLRIKICAFSIQINHYHLLFETHDEKDVEILKRYIHGGVSRIYRQIKHKEVGTFEELLLNPFSCFDYFVGKYGESMMKDVIYSVLISDEDENGTVDMRAMKEVRFRRDLDFSSVTATKAA